MPSEALEEIRRWSAREGSAFHERARNFLSKYDRDLNPKLGGTGTYRVAIGSFSVIEETSEVAKASKTEGGEEKGDHA